jgi:ribosomal protein L9
MKILLLQDIPKLGKKGDIVDVSGGYAKNALFPKHLAKFADEEAIRQWKAGKEKESKQKELKAQAIRSIIGSLKDEKIPVPIVVGKNGEIFTSVHEESIREHIANACMRHVANIKGQGIAELFNKDDVVVHTKPIKELGAIKIPVQLGRGEDAQKTDITIEIVPEISVNR